MACAEDSGIRVLPCSHLFLSVVNFIPSHACFSMVASHHFRAGRKPERRRLNRVSSHCSRAVWTDIICEAPYVKVSWPRSRGPSFFLSRLSLGGGSCSPRSPLSPYELHSGRTKRHGFSTGKNFKMSQCEVELELLKKEFKERVKRKKPRSMGVGEWRGRGAWVLGGAWMGGRGKHGCVVEYG